MTGAKEQLLGAFRAGKVAHAYIVPGDLTLAEEAAAFLLCESAGVDQPCGTCKGCAMRAAGSHPDLLRVIGEKTASRTTIKIEAVRSLQGELATQSVRGGYRVAIIAEAHCMTVQAQNALLKTLEEPEGNVVFFLAGSESGLLPTIRSRCVSLRGLQAQFAGDPQLRARAVECAPLLLENPAKLLPFYYEQKQSLEEVLLWQSLWLRDEIARNIGAKPLLAAAAPAGRFDEKRALATLGLLTQTRKLLRANANPALTADAMVVKISRMGAKELPKQG